METGTETDIEMSVQLNPAPVPASLQMASEVERRLREQQIGVFFVMPRVVRRVLQNELDIASPWQPPPHRKTCVITRDRLLWLVARDELGVGDHATLPEQIILIAQPEEIQLETMTREELQRHYWRLMFHARIDFEMIAGFIRVALEAHLSNDAIDGTTTPFALGAAYFGRFAGPADLSETFRDSRGAVWDDVATEKSARRAKLRP